MGVVLAANSIGRAKVRSALNQEYQKIKSLPLTSLKSKNGDGVAGQTDNGVDTLDDNAEEAEQERRSRVGRLLGAVAALELARATLARSRGRRGCGDGYCLGRGRGFSGGSKERERSEEGEGSGELHCHS